MTEYRDISHLRFPLVTETEKMVCCTLKRNEINLKDSFWLSA